MAPQVKIEEEDEPAEVRGAAPLIHSRHILITVTEPDLPMSLGPSPSTDLQTYTPPALNDQTSLNAGGFGF